MLMHTARERNWLSVPLRASYNHDSIACFAILVFEEAIVWFDRMRLSMLANCSRLGAGMTSAECRPRCRIIVFTARLWRADFWCLAIWDFLG